MLAVGHISVAYLITRWFNGRFGAVSIPLIFTLSVLPDVDLFIPGLTHMGPTHSVIVAVLIFVPFIFVYGKVMIPYFMAYTSHIVLGDFITNAGIWLLWPLTERRYALALPFACRYEFSANLELLLFGFFILVYLITKDYHILSKDKYKLFLVSPLMALLVPLLFKFPVPVPLRLIPVHLILIVVLLLPFFP